MFDKQAEKVILQDHIAGPIFRAISRFFVTFAIPGVILLKYFTIFFTFATFNACLRHKVYRGGVWYRQSGARPFRPGFYTGMLTDNRLCWCCAGSAGFGCRAVLPLKYQQGNTRLACFLQRCCLFCAFITDSNAATSKGRAGAGAQGKPAPGDLVRITF